MGQKLFRDPVYDYIAIDTDKYPWLLELINSPEVQRLRYINQLGLSHFTYPGATHSRLSHSLGVLHLMQQCLEHLSHDYPKYLDDGNKEALLAATLLHDIGHGPFSHATESFFGKHEERSVEIITNPESSVNKILRDVDAQLPTKVASLLATEISAQNRPVLWQRALISSQLDVDRIDFLRRDSLFSGAEYGNFDWYRIIHTMQLKEISHNPQKAIWLFWPNKTKYAIEEYLFSRFYMYQSVYFHRTTRGFEKLLVKILQRAKHLASEGTGFANSIFPGLSPFFLPSQEPSPSHFLGVTDHLLLAQIWEWRKAEDPILGDLSRKFFRRGPDGFKMAREIDYRTPPSITKIGSKEKSVQEYLKQKGLDPEYYLLTDESAVTVYKPYIPEPEREDMSPENVVMIADSAQPDKIHEISQVLPRLKPITSHSGRIARYYCPAEHREKVASFLNSD